MGNIIFIKVPAVHGGYHIIRLDTLVCVYPDTSKDKRNSTLLINDGNSIRESYTSATQEEIYQIIKTAQHD